MAQIIGRRLGIPVYDNALLSEAARASGYSPELFHKRDEKRHRFNLSRIFSSLASDAPDYLGDAELFQMQSDAVREVAAKGSCVIVGRCGDYILRDRADLFSVFLTAPYGERVRRVMERKEVDEETARKIIDRKEKERMSYYNGYTLGKWGDASTYDLCMDSSILGLEGTADFIIRASQQKGGERIADRVVRPVTSLLLKDRPQKAVEYFMRGYGCCQSVVAAFADLYGLSEDQALHIGAGFGGGIGKLRMICGAASGMVILAGLHCDRADGDIRQGKADCYHMVQDLLEAFKKDNGSYICAELLGVGGSAAAGDFVPSERNAEYYKTRPCSAKVESAARIFADYISR